MNKELNDLIQYRIARAREALDEAEILADSRDMWLSACVNRFTTLVFMRGISIVKANMIFSSSKHFWFTVFSLTITSGRRSVLFPKRRR